jgi:hypothetical protein
MELQEIWSGDRLTYSIEVVGIILGSMYSILYMDECDQSKI